MHTYFEAAARAVLLSECHRYAALAELRKSFGKRWKAQELDNHPHHPQLHCVSNKVVLAIQCLVVFTMFYTFTILQAISHWGWFDSRGGSFPSKGALV